MKLIVSLIGLPLRLPLNTSSSSLNAGAKMSSTAGGEAGREGLDWVRVNG